MHLKNRTLSLIFIISLGAFISCTDTSIQSDAPDITAVQLELNHTFSDSIFISIAVTDPQGGGDIDSVWALVGYLSLTNNPEFLLLRDDGISGDSAADDGKFSIIYMDTSGQFQLGPYPVQFRAKDISDNLSDPVDTGFWAVDGDRPVLYNPIAPDSLERGSQEAWYNTIDTYDPNGLSTIDSVYFLVTRPDQTPTGVYNYMYDHGINGDARAGDGRFTAANAPPNMGNQTGLYRFVFYAFDHEINESNHPEIYILVY